MRTLVLGGYGNFGARIGRALAADPAIELLIGGRDESRAQALARELGAGTRGIRIDWAAPGLAETLCRLGVGLLIHTAGPFQAQDHGVARAAARAGAHCIDLADGRRFVCDFPAAVDAEFRAVGRVGISGASTVPGLSSAVVDHLTRGWRAVRRIATCIAPAQTAPRGVATIAAVLGYCGEEVSVWDGGRWQPRRAWTRPERVRFARLRPRLSALCDVPDLELFPARYGVQDGVLFRAALELGLAQRAFAVVAACRAAGLLRRPQRLAVPMHAAAKLLDRLGSARGGMVVEVDGEDAAGRPARREWHITADDDHGPEIPCMAAVLLARRLARGQVPPAGARVCMGLLALEDFRPEFERWGMTTDLVDGGPRDGAPAS